MVVSVLVLLVALRWELDFHEYVGRHFLNFVTFGRWPKENEFFLAGLLVDRVGVFGVVLRFGFGLALLGVMYKYLDPG